MNTKQTEALKLAQDWYDSGNENPDDFANMIKQVIALAEQPAQEPVAWMHTNAIGHVYFRKNPQDKTLNPVPLYTAPQPSKPLTDEQIIQLAQEWPAETNDWASHIDFARAIEQAHGIKGEQK